MMTQITSKNSPIKLPGLEVNEGDIAPNFTVLDSSLNQIILDGYKNKKKLISVIPSIDIGIYDSQTRKFNEEASTEDSAVLMIPVDLPFAQKRWYASSGLGNVITSSNHRDPSSGQSYGLVMGELRSLARSVFMLNENNKVIYKEIVSEGTNYPDFETTLEAYRNI